MFKYHNVKLKNGSFTVSEKEEEVILIANHPVMEVARNILNSHYPEKDFNGKRLIDIGCLEGGYTLEFSKMGFDSLGLEVRDINYKNCLILKEDQKLPNLNFVKDDAHNINLHGYFDVIFCCGLLYHLESPKSYLEKLYKSCKDILILDTHYSTLDYSSNNLSKISTHEGLSGRFYEEYSSKKPTKDEKALLTSWENRLSFWPLLGDLKNCLTEIGFSKVYEVESRTRNKENKRATIVVVK